jgi:hypothetical protein
MSDESGVNALDGSLPRRKKSESERKSLLTTAWVDTVQVG